MMWCGVMVVTTVFFYPCGEVSGIIMGLRVR